MLQACDSWLVSLGKKLISILFTTSWSQGRNLALFPRTMVWCCCTTSFSLFLQAISLGFPEVSQGLFRNPFALMSEHDQKHLAVVYFARHVFAEGPSLTTTLLITLHIISATDSAVCFSS